MATKETTWRKDWPDKKGIYRVRIDLEEETKLVHSVCTLSDRHRWMTLQGHDVVGCTVWWTGEPLNVKEL